MSCTRPHRLAGSPRASVATSHLFVLVCITLLARPSMAVIPTAYLSVVPTSNSSSVTELLASPSSVAGWGADLPHELPSGLGPNVLMPEAGHELACKDMDLSKQVAASPSYYQNGFYLLVDRGVCSFATKARTAQRAGAKGVIIRNTMKYLYELSQPRNVSDGKRELDRALAFSCDNGQGFVPRIDEGAPWETMYTVGDGGCSASPSCASQRCIPTGNTRPASSVLHEMCCVWDLYSLMGGGQPTNSSGGGSGHPAADVSIEALFVTVEGGEQLQQVLPATARVAYRPRSDVDAASLLIWLLGVFVAGYGAVLAAREEKEAARTKQYQLLTAADKHGEKRDWQMDADALAESQYRRLAAQDDDEEKVELTMRHAAGFIVGASLFLLLLFYAQISVLVNVMFAVGSLSTVSLIVTRPMLLALLPYSCKYKEVRGRSGADAQRNPHLAQGASGGQGRADDAGVRPPPSLYAPPDRSVERGEGVDYGSNGDVSRAFSDAAHHAPVEVRIRVEIVSLLLAACVAATWFFCRHESWSWVLQDLMGACLCLVFLSTIQLRSLKVASLLLSLAFCYDVFFVFLSPLIFHQSVMIAVADGGPGPESRADFPGYDFCERYPSDARCAPPERLPMLLRLPKLGDYLGGYAMLGLGDIVLPGLLLAFALRYDYLAASVSASASASAAAPSSFTTMATSAMHAVDDGGAGNGRRGAGKCGTLAGKYGYFPWLLGGYAIGLLMANAMAIMMRMGQPALLYLVPLTLGPILTLAHARGELRELWDGPQVMKSKGANQGEDADDVEMNGGDKVRRRPLLSKA